MKVFLLPFDHSQFFFYSEDDAEAGAPQAPRAGLRGWVQRRSDRLRSSLRHPKGGLTRKMKEAWNWLQRRIHPDEPLLAALRSASTIAVYHRSTLASGEARALWDAFLRRRMRRHLPWLAFDTMLSPLTLLLTPLPGPNVIGYWFAYRAVCHLLILLGIRRALSGRVETTFHPIASLDASGGCADKEWLSRAATQHELKGLHEFVERIAPRPGVGDDDSDGQRRGERDAETMRLLSYNIHKGIGGRDRLYRIERIIRVIAEEDPDVICLQEVDKNVRRTRHDDQPSRLAEAFHAVGANYQLNVHLGHGGYGNLVLSRWPFRGVHQVSLRLKRRKPRGAQLIVVETPEGPLHLVHWHLGLAERERHWQVQYLLEHPSYKESAALPTLIVGDFNDWRNTLGHGPFARHGLAQLTVPLNRFRSFPAYYPVISLDKAYTRGAIDVRHARVVHTHLTRRASDHLPLVIDCHLE